MKRFISDNLPIIGIVAAIIIVIFLFAVHDHHVSEEAVSNYIDASVEASIDAEIDYEMRGSKSTRHSEEWWEGWEEGHEDGQNDGYYDAYNDGLYDGYLRGWNDAGEEYSVPHFDWDRECPDSLYY